MPLTEASFRAASGRRYGCRVGAILTELDDEDRATLQRVLADQSISIRAVARVLTDSGYVVSETSVNRHREHGARCPA